MSPYDLIVIGAGPSGMAMAVECARAGMSVLLLDEQSGPGGQIYRGVTESRLAGAGILDEDYWRGGLLATSLAHPNLTHICGARVWYTRPSFDVWYSVDGNSSKASAKYLAIAVGARERPVAIPGWTLPGVFTAGAAQVLLKTAAIAAESAVLAGSGPLLYLVAAQYLSAGKKVKALLDTTPFTNYRKAARFAPGALIHGGLYKGLRLLAQIRLAGVPVHNAVSNLRIEGDQSAQGISWVQGGKARNLEADTIFLHEGLVPNIEFALAMGCDSSWSSERCAWEIRVDASGESSVPNVYALGDCTKVVGAEISEIQGRLAGLRLARRTGGTASVERETSLLHKLREGTGLRRFLDHLYAPIDGNILSTDPSTVVCRCENLTISSLEEQIKIAQGDLNYVKSITRCGMGPCQGRMCSHSVAALGRSHRLSAISPSRQRLPLAPITIGELANLEDA